MSRVIAVTNRKGGTGKTTTAVNIAAALAHRGHEVLLIDSDPQAHATLSIGMKPDERGLARVLAAGAGVDQCLSPTHTRRLSLLPGSATLAEIGRTAPGDPASIGRLRQSVAAVRNRFDFVVFDTPPTLGFLTLSTLLASDEVYVPTQTHFLAIEGLAELVTIVRKIRHNYPFGPEIRGIIPTFYRGGTNLSRGIIEEIRNSLGDIVLHPIRLNVALAEAPGFGRTIFQYDPRSNGAADYLAVACQIEAMVAR
jgi:chromosome partitioning protein